MELALTFRLSGKVSTRRYAGALAFALFAASPAAAEAVRSGLGVSVSVTRSCSVSSDVRSSVCHSGQPRRILTREWSSPEKTRSDMPENPDVERVTFIF